MWARMIEAQQWKSKKKPTMICGSYSKEKSNTKGTTASALRDAFAHVKVVATQTTTISPGKKVQLSQQYLRHIENHTSPSR